MDTKGLTKAEVLVALVQGAQYASNPMLAARMNVWKLTQSFATTSMMDEAGKLVKRKSYFDYVNLGDGPIMIKCKLEEGSFSPRLYDRDHGPGAAAAAIEAFRKRKAEAASSN